MNRNEENMNLPALPDENIAEKKLKRKEAVHAYYLRNRERIKENARMNYYRKMDEKEGIGAEKPPSRAEKSQESEGKEKKWEMPKIGTNDDGAIKEELNKIVTDEKVLEVKPDKPEPVKKEKKSIEIDPLYLYIGLGAAVVAGAAYLIIKSTKKANAPVVIQAPLSEKPKPKTYKFDAGGGLIIDIPIKEF